MPTETLHAWHDFFVTEAGASSALAGLLFVAVSMNLGQILKYPHLPTRAVEALLTLLSVLVVATFVLVPEQSFFVLGIELFLTGVLTWAALTTGLRRTRRSGYETSLRFLMNQLPPYPVIIAGVSLMLGSATGLYWLVGATLLSIASGVFSAWILLVEIQR